MLTFSLSLLPPCVNVILIILSPLRPPHTHSDTKTASSNSNIAESYKSVWKQVMAPVLYPAVHCGTCIIVLYIWEYVSTPYIYIYINIRNVLDCSVKIDRKHASTHIDHNQFDDPLHGHH